MSKRHTLPLGFVAGSVVLGGIIISVLLQQAVSTAGAGHVSGDHHPFVKIALFLARVLWVLGVVYIVPGVLGVIAACTKNKCLHVVACIFAMISLLIMGVIIVFVGLVPLSYVIELAANSRNCISKEHRCVCRNNDFISSTSDTPFKTCADLDKFVAVGIASFVFLILTWIGMLIEFVVSCCFCCQNRTTPGVVINASAQPMLPLTQEMKAPVYEMGYPLPV